MSDEQQHEKCGKSLTLIEREYEEEEEEVSSQFNFQNLNEKVLFVEQNINVTT